MSEWKETKNQIIEVKTFEAEDRLTLGFSVSVASVRGHGGGLQAGGTRPLVHLWTWILLTWAKGLFSQPHAHVHVCVSPEDVLGPPRQS